MGLRAGCCLCAALCLGLGARAASGDDGAISRERLPLFSISKSENKNQVLFEVRLDTRCRPIGDAPVVSYWRMLERSTESVEPLLSVEGRAYGIGGSKSSTEVTRAELSASRFVRYRDARSWFERRGKGPRAWRRRRRSSPALRRASTTYMSGWRGRLASTRCSSREGPRATDTSSARPYARRVFLTAWKTALAEERLAPLPRAARPRRRDPRWASSEPGGEGEARPGPRPGGTEPALREAIERAPRRWRARGLRGRRRARRSPP